MFLVKMALNITTMEMPSLTHKMYLEQWSVEGKEQIEFCI